MRACSPLVIGLLLVACGGTDCPATSSECDGECVDLRFDPASCGACGVACAAGQVCSDGACAAGCGAGTLECDGRCVDPDLDPANCGSCGTACVAGEVCSEGTCADACGSGRTACDGFCVDTQTDVTACGDCDTSCAAGETCEAGVCTAPGCPAGLAACGGACVDTDLDPAHCGGCDQACPSDQVCSGGSCGDFCGAGTTLCGSACADTQTDEANCGACDAACGAEEACVSGVCQRLCPVGQLDCDGACVDPMSDAAHCGDCATACTMSEICDAGSCATARPVGVVTTVMWDERRGADAWLVYEQNRGAPRRLNPAPRFESGAVEAALLTVNGDAVVYGALDTEGLAELYVARASATGLEKLNAALPGGVGIQSWHVSADGTRLVYVLESGAPRVYEVSLSAPGVATARDADVGAREARIANDGTVVARADAGPLYRLSPGSTAATQISPIASGSVPAFEIAPDGDYAIFGFSDGPGADVYVADVDAATSTEVDLPGFVLEGFDLAVTGHRALVSRGDISSGLSVVDMDAPATPIVITATDGFDGFGGPRLSDDGQTVFFSASVTSDTTQLFAVEVSAPDLPVAVSLGVAPHDLVNDYAVSADGDTVLCGYAADGLHSVATSDGSAPIATLPRPTEEVSAEFEMFVDGDSARGYAAMWDSARDTRDLFTIGLEGASSWERIDLGLQREQWSYGRLQLTPDGSYAIFLADTEIEDRPALFGVDLTGTDRAERLSPAGLRVLDAAVQDDGSDVVFVGLAADGRRAVYVVSTSTPGVATQISPDLDRYVEQVWVDGDAVYYRSISGDLFGASLADPGSHTLLVDQVANVYLANGTVVVRREVGGGFQAVVTRVDGGGAFTRLSPTDADVGNVALSADGAHVYYQDASGDRSFHHVAVATGTITRMTPTGRPINATSPITSADGARLVFLDDGRLAGTTEAFMVELTNPETVVQLNADLDASSDVEQIQITPAGDYVVARIRDGSSTRELFVVAAGSPGTHTKLHEDLSAGRSIGQWRALSDRVVFSGQVGSSRVRLFSASLSSPGSSTLLGDPSDNPLAATGSTVVFGQRDLSVTQLAVAPTDGGASARIVSPVVQPSRVGRVRRAGEVSTDRSLGASEAEGSGSE